MLGIYDSVNDSDIDPDDSVDYYETIHMMLRSDRKDFMWPIE